MSSRVEIKLTEEQMNSIKNIEAKTRYEAIDAVAKILGKRVAQKATWSSSRKTIVIDERTICEITFSKGKVKKIEYFDKGDPNDYIGYIPLAIK